MTAAAATTPTLIAKNGHPILLMGVVLIPFFDKNLGKITTYSPAVVREIVSPEKIVVNEAYGASYAHDADPREAYALSYKGQTFDEDGTIVHICYAEQSGSKGLIRQAQHFCIYRSMTRVSGAVSRNEYLTESGGWAGFDCTTKLLFATKKNADEFIAHHLTAPRLTRPFQVGDRVRTLKPRINSRGFDRFAILTGTVKRLNTGGYGWVSCEWDAECNPDRYANPDAYATTDLELLVE
jgi:hypothetical protein